ncbi:MAG: hypothetical protein LBS03_04715 [Bacteroidales bacterium]|nr:hypothetical protein [Bacteroidales bacterium]
MITVRRNRNIVGILFLSLVCSGAAQADTFRNVIKTIDLINWTHTDYGYTDHPLIVAELHKRYIDIALDCAEQTQKNRQGERFTWTVEALDPFWKWWKETTPDRREKMLKCILRGQIDVNIMPFNIHPMLNEVEVQKLIAWIPSEVSSQVYPRIAIQNDVNGFPRSVASKLAEKGVRHIWMGMNGRHPFGIPTASWWKMPDGRRLFLWNGVSYWAGYDYFHSQRWRRNQHEATNLETGWPRDGHFFKSDEASVRKAHEICVQKLKELENKGYAYEVLPLTFSNQWRCDNDGPYPAIVAFVGKWNELGLQPALRLTTATASIMDMERIAGATASTVEGEFGDWWAFGMTAMPRETATARNARYSLQAAQSPVFNRMTEKQIQRTDEIERDICTYYEHTFAANTSGKDIYGIQNQGTMNETFRYAYKAHEYARWLLAQRARAVMNGKPEGIYVINTQKTEYSGWCKLEKASIRKVKNPQSLIDPSSGTKTKLYAKDNDVYFWIDRLPGETFRRYLASADDPDVEASQGKPIISVNASGWPVSIRWKATDRPLLDGEAPVLHVSRFIAGGWWGATAVPGDYPSVPNEMTRIGETPYTITYSQKLDNQRLLSAERILTVYTGEQRVNVKIIFDRIPHSEREAEVIYAEFPFPDTERRVTATNGGMEYVPYKDHIPNTCKSFFVTDAWVKFSSQDGTRVWASKTSPVFELGKQMFFLGGDISEPSNSNLLQSMIYNNGWGVNFPVEYTGKTTCEYDIYQTSENPEISEVNRITDTYLVAPTVIVHPSMNDYDGYNQWLNDCQTTKIISTMPSNFCWEIFKKIMI